MIKKTTSAFQSVSRTGHGVVLGDAIGRMAHAVRRGALSGKGRFAIVVSRFHLMITQKLLLGALEGLRACGVRQADIEIVWVPGAFEIPQAAQRLARTRSGLRAVLCLGAVIRGETPHFEFICREAARGIRQVGMDSGIPAVFGVLTTGTFQQAAARAGGKRGNKGWDAAMTAVEMSNLFAKIGRR